jgi:hypothetical protein
MKTITTNLMAMIMLSILPQAALSRDIQTAARMDSSFISREEVTENLPVMYRAGHSESAVFKEETITWLGKHDYIVLPGPSEAMNLLAIRKLAPTLFFKNPDMESWYTDELVRFSREDVVQPGWMAIRRSVLPGSLGHTWDDQLSLLSPRERVPNAAEIAWAILVYKKTRDTSLFESKPLARVGSLDRRGSHLYLVRVHGKLFYSGYFDDSETAILGLAAMLK